MLLRFLAITVLVIAAFAVPVVGWLLSTLPSEGPEAEATEPCPLCGGDCNDPNAPA